MHGIQVDQNFIAACVVTYCRLMRVGRLSGTITRWRLSCWSMRWVLKLWMIEKSWQCPTRLFKVSEIMQVTTDVLDRGQLFLKQIIIFYGFVFRCCTTEVGSVLWKQLALGSTLLCLSVTLILTSCSWTSTLKFLSCCRKPNTWGSWTLRSMILSWFSAEVNQDWRQLVNRMWKLAA